MHRLLAFAAVLIAALVSAVLAVPVAALIFRLRGAYFAIGTWVVAEVFRLGFAQASALGGGSGTYSAATGVFTPNNIVKGDGVFCRDIGYAGDYFTHSTSLRYKTDRYTFLVGVDNVFNVAPPLVDNTEVFSIANTAIGNGYDYDGREFFASVEVKF